MNLYNLFLEENMSLEDVASIKIKGGFFETDEILNLFCNNKNHRFCVLFGKNGSGKTTISRAFSKLSGASENTISEVSVLDKDNKVIDITSTSNAKIQVFNEDFIKRNIQIEGDGLDSIVVMGEKKEIDDKIKELTKKLDIIKKKYDNQLNLCNKFNDEKDISSPKFYLNQIKNILRNKGGWAERHSKIHEKKTNAGVSDDTYKKFINIETKKNYSELSIEYKESITKLQDAKSGDKRILEEIPKYSFKDYDIETNARKLLKEKLEKPELTEREKFLFSLLKEHEQHEKWLENIKIYFSNNSNVICPFCCQSIESDYAKKLVESIEKILSKKAEEHKEALQNLFLNEFKTNLEPYFVLNKDLLLKVIDSENILNDTITKFNNYLSLKLSNVYEPVNLPELNIKEKFDKYIDLLNLLDNQKQNYNINISDVKAIIDKLDDINTLLASLEIKSDYEIFIKQNNEKSKQVNILNEILTNKNSLEEQLSVLEQEKKNAKIAMDSINANLKYIFFSKNRLYIDFDNENDRYILYSNDKRVKPENVSVGERNAIALCYFFNQIMKDKEEKEVYSLPYIIVIDDPVSSFDMENRIGIMSYLKYMISKFAIGNPSSKFLIMTHDLQVLFDIYKLIKEISDKAVESFKGFKDYNGFDIVGLINKQIVANGIMKRNEYSDLLEQTYNYALSETFENSNNIGNTMRKALEAFATFTYKKGIEEISTNTKILGELEEPYRSHFENLMYRLVLNGYSHMEDRVRTLNDLNFFDFISDSEKQLTAKNILCFIYMLNSLHLLFHFGDKANEVERNIKKWCKEIIAS